MEKKPILKYILGDNPRHYGYCQPRDRDIVEAKLNNLNIPFTVQEGSLDPSNWANAGIVLGDCTRFVLTGALSSRNNMPGVTSIYNLA